MGARSPACGGRRQKMQGAVELGASRRCGDLVIAIGFIDDQGIGDFNDAFLDALQFVTRAGD